MTFLVAFILYGGLLFLARIIFNHNPKSPDETRIGGGILPHVAALSGNSPLVGLVSIFFVSIGVIIAGGLIHVAPLAADFVGLLIAILSIHAIYLIRKYIGELASITDLKDKQVKAHTQFPCVIWGESQSILSIKADGLLQPRVKDALFPNVLIESDESVKSPHEIRGLLNGLAYPVSWTSIPATLINIFQDNVFYLKDRLDYTTTENIELIARNAEVQKLVEQLQSELISVKRANVTLDEAIKAIRDKHRDNSSSGSDVTDYSRLDVNGRKKERIELMDRLRRLTELDTAASQVRVTPRFPGMNSSEK